MAGTQGQERPRIRTCGQMAVHYALLEKHPEFRVNQRRLAEATMMRLAMAGPPWEPITIPVVVHVLYKADAQDIADAQIQSQIAVLNRDFRRTNPDVANVPSVWQGLAADAGIQFALATKDPQGNPTTGITRTHTTRESFSYGEEDSQPIKISSLGGKDPWPADKYLNIWVGNLSGGLLGYAQFPGGPPETDGVVILNTAFGTTGIAAQPFHLGRTSTHEIGHWLNLRHIWGDEPACAADDLVDDTPKQADANFGKPTGVQISCNNGPHGDMYMNYMDYVDDDIMFMFTAGQVERMHAAIETSRTSFLP